MTTRAASIKVQQVMQVKDEWPVGSLALPLVCGGMSFLDLLDEYWLIPTATLAGMVGWLLSFTFLPPQLPEERRA
jgi:hypothetical protein